MILKINFDRLLRDSCRIGRSPTGRVAVRFTLVCRSFWVHSGYSPNHSRGRVMYVWGFPRKGETYRIVAGTESGQSFEIGTVRPDHAAGKRHVTGGGPTSQ
jgi:hypothetical protein